MEAFLQSLCPSQTPGYAWSVSNANGRFEGGSGGLASVAPRERPLSETTLFDLASLTKPLATALLALNAGDRGELDLESPAPGAAAPGISYLDLLRHQAGFPPWLPLYGFIKCRSEARDWLSRQCPRAHPGRAEYSCLGYILLGFLLEEALGAPQDRLFQERIAGPLGLNEGEACFNPRLCNTDDVAVTEREEPNEAIVARHYGTTPPKFPVELEGDGIVNDGNARFLGGVAGNAGLFGTLKAVEILSNAFRPEVGFLSPGSGDLAWKAPLVRHGQHRSAGWRVSPCESWPVGAALPEGAIGHEGYTGTGVWLEPGPGRTYILLTNRIHPRHTGADFAPARAAFIRAARDLA
jgi:serine-type D-Ala-D-Ala carboxypeptidase